MEHAVGYRIMNRAHAFWSFGFMGAGLFGAGHRGHRPVAATAPGVGGAAVGAGRPGCSCAISSPPMRASARARARPPHFAAPTMAILVLVGVTLSAMLPGRRQPGLVGHLHARRLCRRAVHRRSGGGQRGRVPGRDPLFRRQLCGKALARRGGARLAGGVGGGQPDGGVRPGRLGRAGRFRPDRGWGAA